ncbi:MAG: purine-cytosine permease-like transporter [Alphaproteobacteria bacterium]|nr:purine-cytosine permease-like transporter [Alphaproteobacteria bacterium]
MSHDLSDSVADPVAATGIGDQRQDQRQGWLALTENGNGRRLGWAALSWNTTTTAATLVQLFIGALVTYVTSFTIALCAGVLVTVVGAALGWALGHVACRSGLSSTVLFRHFAFGQKGSLVAILIFGYMIIGFLGLTNALLYYGFLFAFGLRDTLANALLLHGAMTLAWILLAGFAFRLTSLFATTTLILYLLTIGGVTAIALWAIFHSDTGLFFAGSRFAGDTLPLVPLTGNTDKFIFCANLLMAPAGALALTFADIGHSARRSRDIAISAVVSNVFINIILVAAGGFILHAAAPALVDFHITSGLPLAAAPNGLNSGPHNIVPAFVVLGGIFSGFLLLATQIRTQMLNTGCAAMFLSSLFEIFPFLRWRPGWPMLVILANALGVFAVSVRVLEQTVLWATILGVQTAVFAMIIITDYYIIRRLAQHCNTDTRQPPESFNWAGVVTAILGAILSHHALPTLFPLQFLTAMAVCLILYPALRLTIAKPASTAKAA